MCSYESIDRHVGTQPNRVGGRPFARTKTRCGQHNTAPHPARPPVRSEGQATLSVSKTRSCVPTPRKTSKLAQWINGYDGDLVMFLCQGFQRGFKVGFVGTPLSKYVHNLKSTDEHPQVVQDYIDKELQAGRIEGPFLQPPFPKYQMSPVGVVPKKASGEFRIIHNLSYPEGTSVNDKISSSACSVSYASIEDAIHLVKTSGVGSYMAKRDIKKAFRIVPLCPEDYCLFSLLFRMEWPVLF